MKDFENFDDPSVPRSIFEMRFGGGVTGPRYRLPQAIRKNIRRAHPPQVGYEPIERGVADLHLIDVDDRIGEACGGEQRSDGRRLDPRVNMRRSRSSGRVSRTHRGAKLR